MNEPHITLAGNLAFDPTLRTTGTGVPVTTLRMASTPRVKRDGEWTDGETLWLDVVCWKQLADNVSTSLHRGDAITVEGRLFQRTWKSDDGVEHTTLTIDATRVGVDLARYPVEVKKPVRVGAEEAFGDKFVNRETGEIAPTYEPLEDEIAA